MASAKAPAKGKLSISQKMFISLGAGVVVGLILMFLKEYMQDNGMDGTWAIINNLLFQDISAEGATTAIGLFYIVQTLFINGLQLAIVPLVIVSISLSMCALTDTVKLGRIASKTIGGFLLFYGLGCVFAMVASVISINAGWFNATFTSFEATEVASYTVSNPLLIITKAVSNNIFSVMTVNSSILAVVFIACVIGLCMNLLHDQLAIIKTVFEDTSKIINMYLDFVVNKCGPVCIFCMLVRTFAVYGIREITPLLKYMGVTIFTLFLYEIIMYPLLVGLLCKVNPIKFLTKVAKVGAFAFATNSSAATLPLNRRTCLNELGCDETVTDFVLPMGMTINMNGTAIEHVIACSFIATACGLEVTPVTFITLALLAIASSAGTPAIPNSGTVMIYATMTGAGFSSELCIFIYALLITLNKPVDLTVTTLNVVGDAATNCLVCASEGCLDRDMLNK